MLDIFILYSTSDDDNSPNKLGARAVILQISLSVRLFFFFLHYVPLHIHNVSLVLL